MSDKPLFLCDCGSDVLAVSHTWRETARYEEVGHVEADGSVVFEKKDKLESEESEHEWIAYCGGCGHGVTAEWLDEHQIELIVPGKKTP